MTPLSINHKAFNTTTPNLAHIMADLYIYIYNAHIPIPDESPSRT